MKKYLLIFAFLLVNIFWVWQNNALPFIGDDARWLQETNNLAVILKQADFSSFANKWQEMFITNTNSYPRTPLFTLLSVPTMMLFGPNEKAALITNLIVFAFVSWLVYLLSLEIFKKNKHKELIGLVAIVLINVAPGYYGMARLYMSEILQTAFVLVFTLLTLKWGASKQLRVYPILGLIVALAVLLRFILPVYLVVPGLVFVYKQWRLKLTPVSYLARFFLFFLIFIPVAATWYAKNLGIYWEFTRFTSSGPLAEVSSLGPVLSPVTWVRYWKVIALWHFGWPLIAGFLLAVLIPAVKQINHLPKLIKSNPAQLLLVLAPVPALIATTLSLGKTARYFLPVEIFWLIFMAWGFVASYAFMEHSLKKSHKVFLNVAFAVLALIIIYPYSQSVKVFLPRLPATGYLSASAAYVNKDNSVKAYEYLLSYYRKTKAELGQSKFYLLPEQVRLNDAELIWFLTQYGENINTIGEFSPQITLEQGRAKIAQTDVLIIDNNPDIAQIYYPKYAALVAEVKASGEFKELAAQDFVTGSNLLILKRIK